MDWTKWIAELLAAAIGAGLGALFAYRRAYSEEKGKHLATYEDMEFLLAQERGKAYEQEKGKRLATHEDIENVLKEVHAVTEKTETIKAQIGGDLWTRQTIWQQKKEAYFAILKASHALQNSLLHLSSTRMILSQVQQQGLPERELPVELATKQMEYAEAHRKFFDAVDESEIFLESIGRLRGEYVTYLDQIERSTANDQDKATQKALVQGKWRANLIKEAKKDLGVATN